ncbi:MAG: ABC transporter substrate-binding protein [Acidimicrobiales bacterium]
MRAGRGRPGRRAAAAVAAFALLATACIGGGDDGDGADDGPEVTAPTDTLRLGIGGDLVVDPAEASLASASDLMVLDLLHDGLTRLDDAGVPHPALAATWTSNPTATAFQFALSPQATFSSGRKITPQDVIASLERVMAAGDSSLAALSLEAVKGFADFASGKAKHVSGLSVHSPTKVRIELATPLSVLPAVLSSPVLSIVDADTISGDPADLDLSGRWAVTSGDDGVLGLEARDDASALRRVELRGHDDAGEAYEAFEDGKVDWAEVPSDRYDDAVQAHGDEAFAAFQAELFFGMNIKSPALASAPLRQAIAFAIDRQSIVDEVYAELADPLTTVVPAGIGGHDPKRCGDCTFDPKRAKDVLKVGFPDGKIPTVHIDFDESPVQQAMADIVADDLDAVGIPTELRSKSLQEYKSFVVSGDQELFSFGWIGAYRSPDAYLAPLFGSSANDNLTNYRSPAVDLLLADARRTTDAKKQASDWASVEKTVLEADVVVPIAQFRTQVVVADRVQGMAHAVDGTIDWSKVSLSA